VGFVVPKKTSQADAKRTILGQIAQGATVEEACKVAGRSIKSYEAYRKNDKVFADQVDRVRATLRGTALESSGEADVSFADFRRKYLHQETFPHQQNMIDLLEGRDPHWLHPAMTWEPGLRNRVLINIPPNHAKSMTISIDYVTYLMCQNPNLRIKIISQTQKMAADFLYAIKQRLTHPMYQDLQDTFAAGVGFKTASATWQATRVFFGTELRDSSEKDPNIEAVGIGGQIYGARADLIILDDAVTLGNANDFERQIKWLNQDVRSRLGPTGKLVILGTRVASVDLYRELRSPDRYPAGKVPWTYLAMPALLEPDEDPAAWKTLWPWSDQPFDGQDEDTRDPDTGWYPRWNGPFLSAERQQMDVSTWALVYQQQDISDDSTFDPVCVKGSIDGMRKAGPLQSGYPGHPRDTSSMFVVCGMDPAIVGDTAAIAYAVDRISHKRYILEAVKMTGPSPAKIRELIFAWTAKYSPSEWVVEKNAFQAFLTQDENIRTHLATRGVTLREHLTGGNKWDAGFGVASMSPLFGTKQSDGKHHRDNLIHLPSDQHEMTKSLIEQLVTWSPTTKGKTDMVMALWFCEIRARETLQYGKQDRHHLRNPFLTPVERQKRVVINIEDALQDQNRHFV
jgi:hypothetical protein